MEKLIGLIAKLSAIMGQVEEAAKEQFKFNELTLTQMHYLETINHLVNPGITDLATEMNLTKPTITVIVDKLIEKDFVVKGKSDEDRRSTHLHLTEKGKQINQMHDHAHRILASLMTKRLTMTERNMLIELLDKVVREMSKG
jgi:DNA-binding MarR family transcriptional regulator